MAIAVGNTTSIGTNLNVHPYYDDFDETKNYHRIIFRPGLGVQGRELTQMQSLLQNQIDRFAENIYREGSVVKGCGMRLDQNIAYVKLRNNNSTGTSVNVYSFSNKIVKGTTSGVRAVVLAVNDGSEANTPNFKTLFIKYVAANTSGTRTFANNEILTVVGAATTANTIKSTHGIAVGRSSMAVLAPGIIFAKDSFIRVDGQSLFLEKYSANSTYRVGLDLTESIVDETTDTTLLDPASGSYNYTAPGAVRLKITATLAKKAIGVTSANNFVELFQLENGLVASRSDSAQYSGIRDYMAQRTADESGDYIVHGLSLRLREHLKSGNNEGVYASGSPSYGNSSLLAVEIEPGKAYISGYDIEKLISGRTAIDKGIDTKSLSQVTTLADYGNYVFVDNVVGNWDVNGQDTITLRTQQANAIGVIKYSGTSLVGASIGTARVRGIEHYSGTPGLPSAQFKLFLTDINITTAGKSFANTQSIAFSAGSGNANGKADIVASNDYNANTKDSNFDRVIYKLPVAAVKTIRDTSSAVSTDFFFYKAFDVTFAQTTGQATLSTGDNSERLSGSGTLSDAAARAGYYVIARAIANTSTLTGTVTITSGSNSVTGSSTVFTTQVNPGDIIACSATDQFIVSAVATDTTLTLVSTAAASRSGAYHKRFKQGQVLDLGGVGRDGNRSIAISGSPATTATIDINEALSSTMAATAIVKLNKIDGQEATKTVNRNYYIQIRVGSGGGTSYVANTTGPWPLGLSDGYKLVSVRKKSSSNFSAVTDGDDVTSHFTLDTGMRDNYYDHAQLIKKSTSSLATASGDRLLVKLDYFTHVNRQRGYFTVNSYPVNDDTAGSDTTKIFTYQIPVYRSPSDGATFDLRDSIDVRPRVTDTANTVTTLTNISINPLTSTAFDEPSGGLRFAAPQTNFTTDIDYYLERRDLIVMDKSGAVRNIRGAPSLFPQTPPAPKDAMTLAVINVAPYPSLPNELARRNNRMGMASGIIPLKNERFTMRDIGVIRDRVNRLEYYTALSLLEKDTKDLSIKDSSGNDRFKNGIIVDSFTGHGIGNVHDLDYKISIDSKKGEARPPFNINNIDLLYYAANSSNVVRSNITTAGVARDQRIAISNSQIKFANGETVTSGATTATLRYQINNRLYIGAASGTVANGASIVGGTSSVTATVDEVKAGLAGALVTLPYTHEIISTQKYASTTRNLTSVEYHGVGALYLNPSSDIWYDTTKRPDVQINFDNNTDNFVNMENSWQTQWGSWETIWTGEQIIGGPRDVSSGSYVSGTNIVQDFKTEETYNVTTKKSRDGIRNTMIPQTTTQSIGTYVKDVNIIPFMRSRNIRFVARGLKSSTRLYAFFDNINVSAYITPTNSAFANTALEGGKLSTTTGGDVFGFFRLPNEDALSFRVGSKKLRLTDNPTNSSGIGLVTTSAEAYYDAHGLNSGTAETFISTREAKLVPISVSESTTTTDSGTRTTGGGTRIIGSVPVVPPVNVNGTINQPGSVPNDDGNTGGGGGGGGRKQWVQEVWDPISRSLVGLVEYETDENGNTREIRVVEDWLYEASKDLCGGGDVVSADAPAELPSEDNSESSGGC